MKPILKAWTMSVLLGLSTQQMAQSNLSNAQAYFQSYVPQGYQLLEVIEGDLNQDQQPDAVLLVKATLPDAWRFDHEGQQLDTNRRGMVVLLNQQGQYQPLTQNLGGLSSANLDGGVYFAPELSLSIAKGQLHLDYAHGRYGYWRYRFALSGQDLRLIGYDRAQYRGPVLEQDVSINFWTGQKRVRENLNRDQGDAAASRFNERWSKIQVVPIYFSQIRDFDALYFD